MHPEQVLLINQLFEIILSSDAMIFNGIHDDGKRMCPHCYNTESIDKTINDINHKEDCIYLLTKEIVSLGKI